MSVVLVVDHEVVCSIKNSFHLCFQVVVVHVNLIYYIYTQQQQSALDR